MELRQDPGAGSSLSAGAGTPVPASAATSSHRRTRPLPRAAGWSRRSPSPRGRPNPACSFPSSRSQHSLGTTNIPQRSPSPSLPRDALPGPVTPREQPVGRLQ